VPRDAVRAPMAEASPAGALSRDSDVMVSDGMIVPGWS